MSAAPLQTAGGGASQTASATEPVVAGRVVNGLTGTAIARALVQAGSRAMLTDHDGHFFFSGADVTMSSLQITRPGFALSPEQLDSVSSLSLSSFPDKSAIEVRLYPEAILTGTVTAPDGTPLARIPVTIRRSLYSESGHAITPTAHLQTDTQGSFRTAVPAGAYFVSADFSRLPYDEHLVTLPIQVPPLLTDAPLQVHSGEELRVDLSPTLARLHTVTLAASAGEHEGPPPRIMARSGNGLLIPGGGGGGRFRGSAEPALELPSGTFTLEATMRTSAGEEFGQSTVTIPDHDISGISLHFAPVSQIPIEIVPGTQGATVAGAATAALPSPQQISLSLRNVDAGADLFSPREYPVINLGDRTFAFRPAPGRYRLAAGSGAGWYVESATYGATDLLQQDLVVAPSAGSTPIRLLVSNNGGTLDGSVKLSGLPASCWVYAVAADPSGSPVSLRRSTADGAFSFAHLAPGGYRVLAFEYKHSADFRAPDVLANFATRVQSVTIAAGERTSVSLDAVPVQDLLR